MKFPFNFPQGVRMLGGFPQGENVVWFPPRWECCVVSPKVVSPKWCFFRGPSQPASFTSGECCTKRLKKICALPAAMDLVDQTWYGFSCGNPKFKEKSTGYMDLVVQTQSLKKNHHSVDWPKFAPSLQSKVCNSTFLLSVIFSKKI